MKQLTKAEEQVMQVLWELEKGFVKDIIEVLPEPKPAYNTISTIVRILEKKGFVDHNTYGKTHEYYPLMTKEEYSQKYLNNFVQGYFGNSFKQLVSFFTKQENLSLNEIEDIMKILEEEKKNKKGDVE
jgi:predicted transcriptional regulator